MSITHVAASVRFRHVPGTSDTPLRAGTETSRTWPLTERCWTVPNKYKTA